VRAIKSQPGGIYVMSLEWSTTTAPILTWTRITNESEANNVSALIRSYVRTELIGNRTHLAHALKTAGKALKHGPPCRKKVIDVSSDGGDNENIDNPKGVVASLSDEGITVNALAIDDAVNKALLGGTVLEYYRNLVSGFVLGATFDNYAVALRRKLILEIANVHQ
jgi:Ca-activated chloride channel homolog